MNSTKLLYWAGIAACISLIVSCFLPWTYYANDTAIPTEAQRTFTGFYTYLNYYGRPGKFLCTIAIASGILKLLPRVWAKRTDLFLTALGIAYALRIYVEFTGEYMGINPEKKYGFYLMLASVLLIFTAAIFPDLKLIEKKK
jgi:hypothetical protein